MSKRLLITGIVLFALLASCMKANDSLLQASQDFVGTTPPNVTKTAKITKTSDAMIATKFPTTSAVPQPRRTRQPTEARAWREKPYPTSTPPQTSSSDPGETTFLPLVITWPTPSLEQNWLVNGNFANDSFAGWSQVNGYWYGPLGLHKPRPCSSSGTWYLEMDRDKNTITTSWPPPPAEDWAWQDFVPPVPHKVLYLHYEEAHHMHTGIIELTLYGRVADGEGDWEVVFRQSGVLSPLGTGKCGNWGPPATHDFAIPVEKEYKEYRLEIYGKMVDPEDAVLWGDFRVYGE